MAVAAAEVADGRGDLIAAAADAANLIILYDGVSVRARCVKFIAETAA